MMTEVELQILLNEKLCDIADALMYYYDCCQIRGSKCRVADENPCCTGRTIFGEGCPFRHADKCGMRSCQCKLWICDTAVKATDPKCVAALQLLERFGNLFGLVRRPFIGSGYVGSDRPAR